MAWIICHHEFLLSMLGPVGNFYEVIQTYYSPTTMFLHQTPLSVDSFLTLAGILTAYTLMKRKKINVIENYVHRYFRLTPVIGMVILMLATLYTNVGEGPFWAETSRVSNSCRDNWWTFFLYIENYIPAESCIPQGWYLGVDMQCYIVAVIIMVFLKKWSKMTLIGMGVLILLSTVVSFWNCYINRWAVVRVHFTAKADDYNFHYYIKTYTRCGPYLIGMICGYIIYNLKTSPRKYQLTMGKKFLYWMMCLTLLATCIYLPLSLTDDDDSIWQNALFIPVHRLVWSACVCSIVLMCVTDNADFVNSFLSMPIFQVVARLSYCAYIVHNFWILAKVISLKTVVNYYVHQVVVDSWGTTAVSLLLSFILSLMFEMPAPEIEKYCIKFVKKIFAVLSSAMGIKSKASNTL
nr:nose resistant to fluoxetine protein 6-like [Leptinotarsa decemlineata]